MPVARSLMGRNTARPSIFTTNFPLTENPINQGVWLSRDPNQTRVRTTPGEAFGTGVGGTSNFDDSQAHMPGFGTDYEIEAVIFKGAASNQRFEEVELLVRWADDLPSVSTAFGNSTSNGYEWNVAWNGEYQNVGRWKGAAIDTTAPNFVPADGDLMRMRVTTTAAGPRIQCFWNNVQKIDVTDTDVALRVLTGNPGIGFYISPDGSGGSPSNGNFGFRSLTITRL